MIPGELTQLLKDRYGGYEIPENYFLMEAFPVENGLMRR